MKKVKELLTKYRISLVVWCFCFVVSSLFCAGTVAAATDKAGWVGETILDNTKVTGGSTFTKTWTIKNTGTSTWTSSYKLRYVSNTAGRLSSISEVKISGTVAPGGTYKFSVPMKAPAAQSSEKAYKEVWKFTNPSGTTIYVGSSATVWALIKVPAVTLTDKAGWVTETIPDYTPFAGGASFTKTWTIKNTGTSTWTSSYKLRYVSNTAGRMSTVSEVAISGSVAPGGTYKFSVPMKAPAAQSSEKSYKEVWKFTNPAGSTINIGSSATVWALIKVPAVTLTDKAGWVTETIPDYCLVKIKLTHYNFSI
ncbi:MAG: NBR1-Ig-like domain-containing protein [Desulfococcaceae bacterium]